MLSLLAGRRLLGAKGCLKYVAYCVMGYVESPSFCSLKFELPDKEILVNARLLRAKLSESKRVVSGG